VLLSTWVRRHWASKLHFALHQIVDVNSVMYPCAYSVIICYYGIVYITIRNINMHIVSHPLHNPTLPLTCCIQGTWKRRRPAPWRPTGQFACRQCQPPGPSTKRHLVRHDFWSFLERCGTMLPNMMDTLPGYNMTQLPLQVDNSDYTTSIPDVSSVCSERVILTGCPSKIVSGLKIKKWWSWSEHSDMSTSTIVDDGVIYS